MCPRTKQFIQRPGSSVLEEVTTGEQEAVTGGPKCNIWWFLIIAGTVLVGWMGGLTYKHLELRDEAVNTWSKSSAEDATQVEQFKHILYRLDEIDKKLDKRVSGTKMDTLASE